MWVVGLAVVVLLGLAGAVVAKVLTPQAGPGGRSAGVQAAPVDAEAIEHGPIEHRRVFSGSLEASARTTIAPKVGGRIVTLSLDIADPIRRGEVDATLDREESEQLVTQAEADLALAKAGLAEAQSTASNAEEEFKRLDALHADSIVSDSELDAARAQHLATAAAVEVAQARVSRAESELQAARIRLAYTDVRAEWDAGDDERVVAERHAEEGDTVTAGSPILTIVELDPIDAVIFVTESDYARLGPGQRVSLTTDAYPGRTWEGEVSRIAPVFRQGSRQARVEVRVANPDASLKPGMFVRVEAVLGRVEDATIVPESALTVREGQDVVFVVSGDGRTAKMTPVTVGIRDGQRVQVTGEGLVGRVVTLGQQLLGDGSAISLPDDATNATPANAGGGDVDGGAGG